VASRQLSEGVWGVERCRGIGAFLLTKDD
jgi:hypothetical protein